LGGAGELPGRAGGALCPPAPTKAGGGREGLRGRGRRPGGRVFFAGGGNQRAKGAEGFCMGGFSGEDFSAERGEGARKKKKRGIEGGSLLGPRGGPSGGIPEGGFFGGGGLFLGKGRGEQKRPQTGPFSRFFFPPAGVLGGGGGNPPPPPRGGFFSFFYTPHAEFWGHARLGAGGGAGGTGRAPPRGWGTS